MKLLQWIIAFAIALPLLAQESSPPNCQIKSKNDDLQNFFSNINNALSNIKAVNGYFVTSYNLKIDEDCKSRMPIKSLENFYRNTMAEGTQCLKKLSSIGGEGLKNISCFEKLFQEKENPPKLLCGGWPFGNDIAAVGSFPGSSKRHPYLWLSPNISKEVYKNPVELKATIFHEMLHNCGYTHSEGIEIPYTCEECCFNSKLDDKKKAHACNICAGKYQNENDVEYVQALLAWSKDYPNWGSQMRSRTFEIALRNGNKESLNVILKDINLSEAQGSELAKILTSDKEHMAEKLIRFKKENPSLENNSLFQKLLKENNL